MHPSAIHIHQLHAAFFPSHALPISFAPQRFKFSGWELHTRSRSLRGAEGQQVSLTKTECTLLMVLLKHPRQVMSRDAIMDMTRSEVEIFDRAIDVQILRLRRKIERRQGAPSLLRTKRGAGYFLDTEVQPLD